jgi:hypothetical protein
MPFEVVQYPDTAPDRDGTEVTVHWSRDGLVQLEVTRHVWSHACPRGCDGIVTGCSECPRGTTEEFDQAKAPASTVFINENPAADPKVTIYTQPLNRGQINKLIRVLRRARDQAYGEDA